MLLLRSKKLRYPNHTKKGIYRNSRTVKYGCSPLDVGIDRNWKCGNFVFFYNQRHCASILEQIIGYTLLAWRQIVILRDQLHTQTLRTCAIGLGWERGTDVCFLRELKQALRLGLHFLQ
jgi:hypothetical protein